MKEEAYVCLVGGDAEKGGDGDDVDEGEAGGSRGPAEVGGPVYHHGYGGLRSVKELEDILLRLSLSLSPQHPDYDVIPIQRRLLVLVTTVVRRVSSGAPQRREGGGAVRGKYLPFTFW